MRKKDYFKGVELPSFLYEGDGEVKIGMHGDSVCTDEWIEWISKIESIMDGSHFINSKP